jgi:hypothetical protein
MRPTLVFLSLLLIALSIAQPAYSQATPNANPTPVASVSVSPSPTATQQQQTTVKVSTSGLELSGFPTWIIFLLLGVAIVAFMVWFFLLRSESNKTGLLGIVGVLAVIAFSFVFGMWWGRGAARAELREIIGRNASIEIPVTQPAQQTPLPQTSSVAESSPFYMIVMGFTLLLGLEIALYFHLYTNWRIGHWRKRYSLTSSSRDFERFIADKFYSIEERLDDLRRRAED